jgi:hypothetical protein
MFRRLVQGEEIDVDHTMVDIFAFILGITILAMIYGGFRRWLQYKEKMGRLIAEQTAERAAQYGAHMERVEARLKVVEQIVTDGGLQTAAQIDALRTNPFPEPISKRDEA